MTLSTLRSKLLLHVTQRKTEISLIALQFTVFGVLMSLIWSVFSVMKKSVKESVICHITLYNEAFNLTLENYCYMLESWRYTLWSYSLDCVSSTSTSTKYSFLHLSGVGRAQWANSGEGSAQWAFPANWATDVRTLENRFPTEYHSTMVLKWSLSGSKNH